MDDPRAEVPDRTSAEDLSPVWLMLAGAGQGSTPLPVVCALSGRSRDDWQDVIAQHANEAQGRGATLIVAVQKPISRLALDLLARRRPSLRSSPSPKSVWRALEASGLTVKSVYTLWPSIRFPRVAFPAGESRVVIWAQRSGVLGGGGNRLWARLAARSWFFTPLAVFLAPGVAYVVPAGDQDA